MKKKLLSMMLATTMILTSLSGCGKKEEVYRSLAVDEMNGSSVVMNGYDSKDAYVGLHLVANDYVTVGDDADMTVLADADKYLYAESNAVFSIEAAGSEESTQTRIKLDNGGMLYRIDEKLEEGESFEVESCNSTMAVRGTIFRVDVYSDGEYEYTLTQVFDGKVEVTPGGDASEQAFSLVAGEEGLVRSKDEAVEVVYANQPISWNLPDTTMDKLISYADAGCPVVVSAEELAEIKEGAPEVYDGRFRLKSVTHSYINSASGEKYEEETFIYEYDENGNLLTDEQGRAFQYDGEGNMIYSGEYYSEELGTYMYFSRYAYDENNRLVQEEYYGTSYFDGSEMLNDMYTYTYNENGEIAEKVRYWGDMVVAARQPVFNYYYSYDANGYLESVAAYASDDGTYFGTDKYYHTDDGKLTRVEYCDEDGSCHNYEDYTYNEKGQLTEKVIYDEYTCEGDSYTYYRYEYDEYGNLIHEEEEYPGFGINVKDYTYEKID